MELTELEALLALPTGEAMRRALLLRLADAGQRLRAQIAAGLPRRDFADWQAAAAAVLAAEEVLRAWPVGEKPASNTDVPANWPLFPSRDPARGET